jgi:hypothetical protein
MRTYRGKTNDIVFLLGAGASVDAGLPTVAKLTEDLRNRLPTLSDPNGVIRPEFGQVFDLIETYDPSVAKNYERFFEWIKLLLDVKKEPFRKLICTNISNQFIELMAHLSFVVGEEIAHLLQSKPTTPDYLRRLTDFLPEKGRLKVFTLNYDCCLEDICQAKGVELTTGFDPKTKKWKPSLFRSKSIGINLFKLHGSLRWFGTRDKRLSNDEFQYNLVLMELRSEERENLPSYIDVSPKPELILGPGNKIQPDDPFLTLFYEFQSSLLQAKICVIIGYSYQDFHINSVLDQAVDRGIRIVDVNPTNLSTRYLTHDHYHHLPLHARDASVSRKIISEIRKI